jgi:uncharacterized membrane protein YciS (DUF1049 family)
MKFLFWLIAIPALAVAMSFGVSNPQSVALRLWPLVNSVEMPLYAAVTIALFFGLLVGGLIAWIDGLRHRAEARRLARRLRELEAEDARLRRELAMAKGASHGGESDPDSSEAARRLNVANYE